MGPGAPPDNSGMTLRRVVIPHNPRTHPIRPRPFSHPPPRPKKNRNRPLPFSARTQRPFAPPLGGRPPTPCPKYTPPRAPPYPLSCFSLTAVSGGPSRPRREDGWPPPRTFAVGPTIRGRPPLSGRKPGPPPPGTAPLFHRPGFWVGRNAKWRLSSPTRPRRPSGPVFSGPPPRESEDVVPPVGSPEGSRFEEKTPPAPPPWGSPRPPPRPPPRGPRPARPQNKLVPPTFQTPLCRSPPSPPPPAQPPTGGRPRLPPRRSSPVAPPPAPPAPPKLQGPARAPHHSPPPPSIPEPAPFYTAPPGPGVPANPAIPRPFWTAPPRGGPPPPPLSFSPITPTPYPRALVPPGPRPRPPPGPSSRCPPSPADPLSARKRRFFPARPFFEIPVPPPLSNRTRNAGFGYRPRVYGMRHRPPPQARSPVPPPESETGPPPAGVPRRTNIGFDWSPARPVPRENLPSGGPGCFFFFSKAPERPRPAPPVCPRKKFPPGKLSIPPPVPAPVRAPPPPPPRFWLPVGPAPVGLCTFGPLAPRFPRFPRLPVGGFPPPAPPPRGIAPSLPPETPDRRPLPL